MAALRFETRSSDSPWIDTVWTCTSEQVSEMTSVAAVGRRPSRITVVTRLGYFDQSHLTRSLRRYIGRTTTQLRDGTGGVLGLSLDQPLTS